MLTFDTSRPLAFMHIPKTSGSTLIDDLVSIAEPKKLFTGFDCCLFGSFRDFNVFDSEIRQHIYEWPTTMPAGADLVAGHIALSSLRQAYPSAQLLTVLREPISRLLSHWLYWRQFGDESLALWGAWGDRVRYARQPLNVFLQKPLLACQIDNLALRMLLWPHPKIPVDNFIDPADDEQLIRDAMDRVDSFNFVDIIENNDFVANLEQWLCKTIKYKRNNETSNIPLRLRSPLHLELTSKTYELLSVRSRLDLKLWTGIAGRRLHPQTVCVLREQTILATIKRYTVLMDTN